MSPDHSAPDHSAPDQFAPFDIESRENEMAVLKTLRAKSLDELKTMVNSTYEEVIATLPGANTVSCDALSILVSLALILARLARGDLPPAQFIQGNQRNGVTLVTDYRDPGLFDKEIEHYHRRIPEYEGDFMVWFDTLCQELVSSDFIWKHGVSTVDGCPIVTVNSTLTWDQQDEIVDELWLGSFPIKHNTDIAGVSWETKVGAVKDRTIQGFLRLVFQRLYKGRCGPLVWVSTALKTLLNPNITDLETVRQMCDHPHPVLMALTQVQLLNTMRAARLSQHDTRFRQALVQMSVSAQVAELTRIFSDIALFDDFAVSTRSQFLNDIEDQLRPEPSLKRNLGKGSPRPRKQAKRKLNYKRRSTYNSSVGPRHE